MNILGIHFGHDSSISFLKDGKLIFCKEIERDYGIKHLIGVDAKDIKNIFSKMQISLNSIDFCAVTTTQNIEYIFNKPEKLSFKVLNKKNNKLDERYSFKKENSYFYKQVRNDFKKRKISKYLSIGAMENFLDHTNPNQWGKSLKLNQIDKYITKKSFDKKMDLNFAKRKIILKLFGKEIPGWMISHHLAHASYAFHLSGFNKAAVLSQDGGSAWNPWNSGMCYYGNANKVKVLMPHNLELGRIYEEAGVVLGFEKNPASGKLMGLAPYGKNIFLNKKFIGNRQDFKKIKIKPINKEIKKIIKKHERKIIYKWLINCLNIAAKKKYDLSKFGKIEFLHDKINVDFAASTQALLDDTLLKTVNKMKKSFEMKGYKTNGNICLTGGTALNCPSNSNIYNKSNYKKVFVPPAVHDGGLSMGSVLYIYYDILNNKISDKRKNNFNLAYLGQNYKKINIKDISSISKKIKVKKIKNIHKEISKKLHKNKVIGLFYGKSEIGPRALGHRSILANVKYFSNWAKVNKIKNREQWRPLAPSILIEKFSHWFSYGPKKSPYMLFTHKLKKNKNAPAITHIDNSSRVQTVDKKSEHLYSILTSLEKISGIPLVLNTSLNAPGKPIVETPNQAVKLFLSSDLDYLFLESFLIEKKSN